MLALLIGQALQAHPYEECVCGRIIEHRGITVSTEVYRSQFPGSQGHALSGRLDLPEGEVRGYALFAHCFTCGKDSIAASRIAKALMREGIAVFRFDFTGIGGSGGDFGSTNYSSNVGDILAAAEYLRETQQAPTLLIGHSLGGAAILSAANRIPEARAVVVIGAPSDPKHVMGLFGETEISVGDSPIPVKIGGRSFRISRKFVEDVANQKLLDDVARLNRPLLVLHAPNDSIVCVGNGLEIFNAARQPKSFVSLDGANHLLTNGDASEYAAAVISAWSRQYLKVPMPRHDEVESEMGDGLVRVDERHNGKYQQSVRVRHHRLVADEPVSDGGLDGGPGPYELLMAALGSCSSMTIRGYAERKGLPLEHVSISLSHTKVPATLADDCSLGEGTIDVIKREISLTGPLSAEQRASLMAIAEKCPVHRTLQRGVCVRTAEA